MPLATLCRDCLHLADSAAVWCPACGSGRVLCHDELTALALAHIDCDAFYATVEKRDNPELADKPLIVGGGHRGVVTTACYIARRFGVRSAMPMFKALKLCPQAVVIKPNMAKYAGVSREIRALFLAATPLVEPLSLDEAYLDLAGTERLHGRPAAATLADIAGRIEREIGITVSIGLSYNKILAKMASGLLKPRGFTVIGRAEAVSFLGRQPVGAIYGVGEALAGRLAADGIARVAQLQATDPALLARRYGSMGVHLAKIAQGIDERPVVPGRPTKSVSAETTFNTDHRAADVLLRELWPLCERVAARLKSAELAGITVTVKLKTADFRSLSRSSTLAAPTQLAEALYRAAAPLVEAEADGRAFRLIGVGLSGLGPADNADPPDLIDPAVARRKAVEQAMDRVRAKFGRGAIVKGRGLG
ncbi:MAG TPA: DNA polymerase IV [Alphaproteobacteria bacterium]|nr:DNA polymerase IV [Alphaproteobacteria bacterium]